MTSFSSRNLLLILLSFCLVLLLAGCGVEAEQLAADTVGAPEVDRTLLMPFVEAQLAMGARHSGSEGARKTAEWIRKESGGELQVFTEYGKTYRNVVRIVPGTDADGRSVVVGAHYDTKVLDIYPRFDGANDGASGVAALLAMIRALPEKTTLPFDLHFVFFDGEEARFEYSDRDGLHGSRHYVKQIDARKCCAMILLDMIGDKDLDVRFPSNCSRDLVTLAVAVSRKNGTLKQFDRGGGDILDDHLPFLKAGIPAIDFIDFNYGPDNRYWHTDQDSLDKISAESMAMTADTVLEFIWALGAAEQRKD